MDKSLKIIKNSLRNVREKLTIDVKTNSNGTSSISNLKNIRSALLELSNLKIFNNILENLFTSIIFSTNRGNIIIQQDEGKEIVSALNNLKELVENLFAILIETLPEEDINSINIKLPELNDFDELSNISRNIHIALTQVIFNDEINGVTKIVSVEQGSIWINVFVGSSALGVIASLTWSASVIYKKILECQLVEQQVRALKINNENIKELLRAQKCAIDNMIEAEAINISSENFKQNLPENTERIKNSIKLFAELIEKGAEIHPSLYAPEEVSNLFPDMKNLAHIETKIKKLANPNNN